MIVDKLRFLGFLPPDEGVDVFVFVKANNKHILDEVIQIIGYDLLSEFLAGVELEGFST